jgi:hypothetical protein
MTVARSAEAGCTAGNHRIAAAVQSSMFRVATMMSNSQGGVFAGQADAPGNQVIAGR